MSLEAGIAELNTNIKALIAALATRPPTPDTPSAAVVDKALAAAKQAAQAPAPQEPQGNAQAPAAAPAAPTPPTAAAAPAPAAAPATKDITYEADVKPAILALAKSKGRAVAANLLQRYGAPTGDKLQTGDYSRFLDDVKELMK